MQLLLDDNALAAGCRQRDSTAQRLLYEKYSAKMMSVCVRFLKNKHDSTEVLNSAFAKVFEKIPQFKAEGRLEAWIKRIVINSSLDFIKYNKSYRSNFIQTHEIEDYGNPEAGDIDDEWYGAALRLSQSTLYEMILDLPPASRVVFNMYAIESLSHKQIAEKLKISESTSKWHLHNARTILKRKVLIAAQTETPMHYNEKIGKQNR